MVSFIGIDCHRRSGIGAVSKGFRNSSFFLPIQRALKSDPADSKKPRKNGASKVAEAQRFELWDPCESAVFKSAEESSPSKGLGAFSFP